MTSSDTGRVTIRGQARLVNTTRLAARRMGTGYGPAEDTIGTRGAVLARGRVPRRSGALASTIAADAGTISVGTSYAAAQEYGVGPRVGLRGGHNIRARRFMRGAADAVQPFAISTVAAATVRIVATIEGA